MNAAAVLAGHRQPIAPPRARQTAFDYGILDEPDRERVHEDTRAIQQFLSRSIHDIIQIGLRLLSVRKCTGRVGFQAWRATEICLSQATTSNYMRAAAVFDGVKSLGKFHAAALFILARRRVPHVARTEAIELADAGETISRSVALRLIEKHVAAPDDQSGEILRKVLRKVRDLSGSLELLTPAEKSVASAEFAVLLALLQEALVPDRRSTTKY